MHASNFDGKVVVVTGATGLLGSRVVSAFEDGGATVIRVMRKLKGMTDRSYACDVTNEMSVEQCFQNIAADHGSIFGLIHTVGKWGMSSLLETSLEEWKSMLALNLASTFLCFRESARHMGDVGRLVAIASRQGADGGVANQASYSASKGGLVRLVESVAEEYNETMITANAIAPYQIAARPDQSGVTPTEIASACMYLCSEHAKSVSGEVLRMYA